MLVINLLGGKKMYVCSRDQTLGLLHRTSSVFQPIPLVPVESYPFQTACFSTQKSNRVYVT